MLIPEAVSQLVRQQLEQAGYGCICPRGPHHIELYDCQHGRREIDEASWICDLVCCDSFLLLHLCYAGGQQVLEYGDPELVPRLLEAVNSNAIPTRTHPHGP